MKILLFADNHFCEKASILQMFGDQYTKRLENQIESINWLEQLAVDKKCEAVIGLGDFFDKADLTDQEITAIRDIKWNNLYHYFLVGNHESASNDLQFNSTNILESPTRHIISEAKTTKVANCDLCFLPYVIESDRKPINEYFAELETGRRRIIFSHNDISGIQMGPVISKIGFELSDIENSCNLFINGHLHNGQWITKKVLNLGNLTGHDFGEDATRYPHNVLILDTETLTTEMIENPYAINFYKIVISEKKDLKQLSGLKNNAVLSVKCVENLNNETRALLNSLTNILAFRLIMFVEPTAENNSELTISDLTVDYLAKFIECCHMNIDNSSILEAELAEICK